MSIRSIAFSALLATLGLHANSALSAQTPATHAIVGTVTTDSTGLHGLGNVEITIPTLGLTTRTTTAGDFRISVPEGRYLVVARLVGYASVTRSVAVSAGADARLDFVFDQRAVTLDSVVTQAPGKTFISPNLNGFEERSQSHQGGYFISDSTLRRNEEKPLPDILASRVAGLTFYRSTANPRMGPNGVWAISTRSGGGAGGAAQCGVFQKCLTPTGQPVGYTREFPDYCYASIYLDNLLIYDASKMTTQAPPDLNSFKALDLAGVEFYPGPASTPAQFGSSVCGTLVLWTREK